MSADIQQRIHAFLEASKLGYEVMACDPELADTAVFCRRYDIPLENSVNTLLVKAKTGGERFAACVLLANTRLDVNRVVRKRLQARRVSFASADETRELTGMEIGGVTPICLPLELPLWIDQRVMEARYVILGGGNRASKIKISPHIFDQVLSSTIVDGLAMIPPAAE
jgi:prolyl-tRNA editing enzyme YbaK/EbsC (Cys-tRNA(Pro) deacylase)